MIKTLRFIGEFFIGIKFAATKKKFEDASRNDQMKLTTLDHSPAQSYVLSQLAVHNEMETKEKSMEY